MTATAILAPVASKTCSRCSMTKPSTSDFWYKRGGGRAGFQPYCKDCQVAVSKLKHAGGLKSKALADRALLLMDGLKRCTACALAKPVEAFQKKHDTYDGLTSRCTECERIAVRKNKVARSPGYRAYLQCKADKERLANIGLKRCPCCDQEKQANGSNFYKNKLSEDGLHWVCKKCDLSRLRKSYQDDPDVHREASKTYRLNNKQKVLEAYKRWTQASPVNILATAVRRLVGASIRRRGYTKRSRTHEILGCDWEFFKAHIERQFPKGMNWDNRSEWHLDHIRPMASAENEDEVIALNHFTNLRPLWAKDNMAKHDKITHLI